VEISPKKNIEDIVNTWLNNLEDKEVKQELVTVFKDK
jgi:hypothetical protein